MKKFVDSDIMQYEILKGAVENTNEAFVTIDQQSTVIFFNKAAEKLFGYSREEVIGKDLSLILSPACREGHNRAVEKYIHTREAVRIGHESELAVTRKNGEIFPASISFSMAELDGALYFTGIIRDLTETKELQKRIIQTERLAALGQTVAEISHEIKNPLIMIGGFAKQLLKKATDRTDKSKLTIIAGEVERLEELLAELKELYRPKPLSLKKIDLVELLHEVVSLAKAWGKENHIQIRADIVPQRVCVESNRSKLKQVLLNLVKNSIEALPNGGVITITLKEENDRVEARIADAGVGIPAAVKEKMFSPFFTTKKHGTGLGLSITKRIVEEHPGGTFAIESEEGKGTVVTIGLSHCQEDEIGQDIPVIG